MLKPVTQHAQARQTHEDAEGHVQRRRTVVAADAGCRTSTDGTRSEEGRAIPGRSVKFQQRRRFASQVSSKAAESNEGLIPGVDFPVKAL